jgi:Undecaprenyl-phosphate galactose phosphotransferase WbaP
MRAVALSFLIIIGGSFLIGSSHWFHRTLCLLAWLVASGLVPLCRYLTRLWCSRQPWWGIPTIILGERIVATLVLDMLQSNPNVGLRPIAILVDSLNDYSSEGFKDVFCGDLSHSELFAQRHHDCYAILAAPQSGSGHERTTLAKHADWFRRVLVIPDLMGFSSLAVRAREIHGILGLEIDHNLTKAYCRVLKRAVDVLGCVTTALMTLPLLLIVAIAVALTSPGPIFYCQFRIGRNGREFRLWKFRTMVVDADAGLEGYLQKDPSLRAEWNRDHKLRKDPRVTTIGRLLRRTSMDELPQLWNVLRGEMSLVGPRPISHTEVKRYGAIFDQYRRVVPGLTGMWQISGRNNTTYEHRTQLDDYYVRNWSTSLDLYILLRTLRTIIFTEGAY